MFEWLFGNRYKQLEEKTEKSFSAVKTDIESVGKWLKHLNQQDKQLFDAVNALRDNLSSVEEELAGVRESLELDVGQDESKQLFKKSGNLSKQTAVQVVEDGVQTGVQTGNFYDILRNLSANERLLIFTLMNSEMKLSYEDLALLLRKERATIRGQINSIKQKSEGLLNELTEKNGKKRVFISSEIKEKLAKYAKVRVKKSKIKEENERNDN